VGELEYAIRHGGLARKQLLTKVSRRGFGAALLSGLAGAAAPRLVAGSRTAEPGPDFTIAIIPDPQFLAESCPDGFGGYYVSMMQWIATNRNLILTSSGLPFEANIKAVVGVGDCVNSVTGLNEFVNAENAWSILDAAGMPFITPPGNHDYAGGPSIRSNLGSSFATGYFSSTNRAAVYGSGIDLGSGDKAYWAGSFDSTGANTAVKFEISHVRLLILAMDFFAGTAAWSWAYDVMLANPDFECYITTHAWLTASGTQFQRADGYGPNTYLMDDAPYSNSAAQAWNTIGVGTWPNLFGIFSGHDLIGGQDPAALPQWYWQRVPVRSESLRGQTVQQLFANSQQIDNNCSSSPDLVTGAGQMASVFLLTRRPALGVLEGRMISTHTGNWFGAGAGAFSGGTSWSVSETLLFSVPFTGFGRRTQASPNR
jgi:hypothetical protein